MSIRYKKNKNCKERQECKLLATRRTLLHFSPENTLNKILLIITATVLGTYYKTSPFPSVNNGASLKSRNDLPKTTQLSYPYMTQNQVDGCKFVVLF